MDWLVEWLWIGLWIGESVTHPLHATHEPQRAFALKMPEDALPPEQPVGHITLRQQCCESKQSSSILFPWA
uniref:Putative secreted protein n=1 Tax=Amblyomma cajennense TaxID=34607 RepID=A0A023FB43_AMBCJ